ncbi:MAG: triose-phosphate isomerase [bacterium]
MQPIIIANWKMSLRPAEARRLLLLMRTKLVKEKNVEIVICPSFTELTASAKIFKGTNIAWGSQDVFWEESGAYTGEISALSLKELGCEYVIIGHSERRRYLHESDEMVNKKTVAVISSGLTPIVCVGETLSERQEGQTEQIITRQIKGAFNNIDLESGEKVVVAYEPVWAIGTGKATSSADAEAVFSLIHDILLDLWSLTIIKNNVKFVYGGSVDSQTAKPFISGSLCNGFLVGGASLKPLEFAKISQLLNSK